MKRAKAVVVVTLLALSACRAPAVKTVRAVAPAPRVLITIVVDQLASWMADERWAALPADGGFARLRREGLTVRQLRYQHALTDTAPGHSALYTGAVPRETGIFANETLGPDGHVRSILLDEATRLVDVHGNRGERPGSSLARLRVPTLADGVEQTAGARVYSFSLKDRGALFAAGRRPTAALWFDVASDSFVTSTAFPAPPAWAGPLADHAAVAAARAGGWALDDETRAWVAAHAETADDQAGEGDLAGLGRTFPHAIGSAKAMRATPVGDRVLFALARAALDEIGAHPRPEPALLALSLSSNDYVNHVFGPHSWEAWAELRELDARLATLLSDADRAVGPDGYAVLLTSDHGGGALPEVDPKIAHVRCVADEKREDPYERVCAPRRRVLASTIVTTLEAALAATVGPGPWVSGFADPLVYLTPKGRALDGPSRERLVAAAKAALRAADVYDVVDARAATAPCSRVDVRNDKSSLEGQVCRAIDPTGPGDLYLVLFRGAFFDPDVVAGFGTSHGSPYLYDRAVPLLVRAPGVPPGRVSATPVSAATFTRTAAALLGIRVPANAGVGENLVAEPPP
jgi:Type I phosphodiesterase / nucleotide pyrophosphatase